MDSQNDGPLESRPPTLEDFVTLCRRMNEEGVDYLVVGGMAIIQHGYVRATEDIDLLVRTTRENEERIRKAMLFLPDRAIEELEIGDIDEYVVVRVADEIIVDLMKSACGIDYEEAAKSTVLIDINGVKIPFASVELLWRMKQTVREKDKLDQIFLREKMQKQGKGASKNAGLR